MLCRWNGFRLKLRGAMCFALVLYSLINECYCVNYEGLALLKLREKVETDPYGSLTNWNSSDLNPCMWFGVHCEEGLVHTLDLEELSLAGKLVPELGSLSHLKALILSKNQFSGGIPTEIARLTMLELLDLRSNNLRGTIPTGIGDMPSLKHLLLCDNKFEGNIQIEFEKLKMLKDIQCDRNLVSSAASNRKIGLGFKSSKGSLHAQGEKCIAIGSGSSEPSTVQNFDNRPHVARRKLLGGSSSNLAALPATEDPTDLVSTIPSMGSGSFPATTGSPSGSTNKQHQSAAMPPTPILFRPRSSSNAATGEGAAHAAKRQHDWKYIYVLPAGAFVFLAALIAVCMCQSKGVAAISPWKTGLSGQLQKAFITGVPKLNRAELEIACEDFSNIIATVPECKVFKGTLSSGVEVAVAISSIKSIKDWSKRSEQHFRKKIDTFSRMNHKNFVNLLGYCEEDEPFLRLMVFEYAPSGTLHEHLHVREEEHLDWPTRMRIIMGIAYCLHHMHHEMNPSIVHPHLQSDCVLLTEDNAAKVTDYGFWKDLVAEAPSENDAACKLPRADTASNVYNFGILMLEIITGKLPHSDEQGSLVNWANEYFNDKGSVSYMIDPTLKSFKSNELDAVCQVIQECLHPNPRQRPTMREVTTKLREVLGISPDAATPKLSPLWWAELEILSVEAS